MKFFADENFPGQAVHALREQGFEIRWATEEASGSADEDLLARCAEQQLTLLTLDKDFGELVFRRGLPAACGVILFRAEADSPKLSPKSPLPRCDRAIVGMGFLRSFTPTV